MDQTLGYLREILSGHTDSDHAGKILYHKLVKNNYKDEEAFVRDLSSSEGDYLNKVLKEAIDYSEQEGDSERAGQLNEVYELLIL
ncbi:sigma-G-dependent sporulation-specific acid-soluble spore protein CsgA [Peribacillus sp. B-H-3]|jgi:hypothetical protein|uniref:sigma-G-dependent sporulation-specific acid-soluble spore protein CsgA n=1 Tax=Bacillaceae TaxID=186817 RepID=UPI0008EE6785|nr:sigma-G-dependent sporulation-specific acid-soluble spore protein CsgA [Bacillus sp. OV322]SFB94380.1 hypothetical protein SAMN05443252_101120 [Bacillus sp. OV322]